MNFLKSPPFCNINVKSFTQQLIIVNTDVLPALAASYE